MKNIILTLLLFCGSLVYSQSEKQIKIRVLKEDSTLQVNSGDSSYVYNVFVISTQPNTIQSIKLLFQDKLNSNWTTIKDSTYSWSSVTCGSHGNISYKICKPNANQFKLCLGRLYFSKRQKFAISVNSGTKTITKEFDF